MKSRIIDTTKKTIFINPKRDLRHANGKLYLEIIKQQKINPVTIAGIVNDELEYRGMRNKPLTLFAEGLILLRMLQRGAYY